MTFWWSFLCAEVPSHLEHLGRHITDRQACKIQNKNLIMAGEKNRGWAVIKTPYLGLSRKFLLLFHPLFLVGFVTIGLRLQKLYIQDWLTEACPVVSMAPEGCWPLIWDETMKSSFALHGLRPFFHWAHTCGWIPQTVRFCLILPSSQVDGAEDLIACFLTEWHSPPLFQQDLGCLNLFDASYLPKTVTGEAEPSAPGP